MASLHEGVFLNKTHGEAYLSIFSPTVEQYDDQSARSPSKLYLWQYWVCNFFIFFGNIVSVGG